MAYDGLGDARDVRAQKTVTVAVAVNADGHREVLGLDVTSGEDGAGWLAFLRGLSPRGLSGAKLVTAQVLVAAIGPPCPAQGWWRRGGRAEIS